jgi:polysaccharide deacetylase family protein (PEP-CTERM system associated)
VTYELLDVLADMGIRGTFFVVGDLIDECAPLIRRIASYGHEVALHGWNHVLIEELTSDRLAKDLRKGKALLEDLTESEVRGFRAPMFGLTPRTRWAVDVIGEAGFDYSSSVLPSRSPISGYPGAPLVPFRWANGLMEFPVPVGRHWGYVAPFLGGVYLRYLPFGRIVRNIELWEGSELWLYSHPYDFDVGEPYHRLPWASHVVSGVLHFRRRVTYPRLARLYEHYEVGKPIFEIANYLSDSNNLDTFNG